MATINGDSLLFDKGESADVEIYKTLKDLSNGYFRGGECEAVDMEVFTPNFGECKEITEIDDFLHHVAKDEGLSEIFFNVEWQRNSEWLINPETLALKAFKEGSPDDNTYYHWQAGKLEQLFESELLEVGEDDEDEDEDDEPYEILELRQFKEELRKFKEYSPDDIFIVIMIHLASYTRSLSEEISNAIKKLAPDEIDDDNFRHISLRKSINIRLPHDSKITKDGKILPIFFEALKDFQIQLTSINYKDNEGKFTYNPMTNETYHGRNLD